KRHQSSAEPAPQPVKRKTTEPPSPSAKRRSTTRSSSRSKAAASRPAGPSRDSIRVVPLGNDGSRTAYGEFGIDRSKSKKRGMDSSSHSSSSRKHEKHSQKRQHGTRGVNVNKDLPRPNHK
ncbi:hypothetical protein GGF43_006730, partial [Coemansia sp. RSA 2618]